MKTSRYICLLSALFAVVSTLFSACKDDKPLQLQGVWQEESYWTPNDSIAADTLIHTYTLRNISFDCGGGFQLKLTTYHHPVQNDAALGTEDFTEYVKGVYTTTGRNINMNGIYYTDDAYSTVADSTNTPYSFGDYLLETTFKLDDQRLILGATTPDNPSQHTFSQTEAFDCY